MKRGSRIGRVLNFFRNGDADEIMAVFHILVAEGLVPQSKPAPAKKRGRRSRLNGADPQPESTQTREATA